MDCVICYESTEDAILPCQHAVCKTCAGRWFSRKVICPMCMQIPAAYPLEDVCEFMGKHVFITQSPIGLAVSHSRGRVVVKHVKRKQFAYKSGLRKGDVIHSVNGIPVKTHSDTISIINRAEDSKISIRIRASGVAQWCSCVQFNEVKDINDNDLL